MGSRGVLSGLLWRARAGLRLEGAPLHAGHGMADQNYRPPRLPYASVVGPLCVELETDRDAPRSIFLWVQAPGHLPGAERTPADPAPAPGDLALVLDGDTAGTVPLDLGALAGRPLTDPDVGPQVARIVETAVRAGEFTVGGAPVTDPARLAELAAVTARWDRARSRLVLSSGRRGVVNGAEPLGRQPSTVELGATSPVATALGLAAGTPVPGRVVRHRRPTPTAVAVDVRFDLWAGSQSELATALDLWTRITATRGQLLVRPALLADDVPAGATSIRLAAPAEPAARDTLVQWQPTAAGLLDRLSGDLADLSPGAVADAAGVTLSGGQRATLGFFEAPPVPLPWEPDRPGARGYAATAGLRVPAGTDGELVRVLTVLAGDLVALRLDVAFVADGGGVAAELRGSAMLADGGELAAAAARVPVDRLAAGTDVHLLVDARTGTLALFAAGEPIGAAVGPAGPAGPTPGGTDMLLVAGPPDGAPDNPRAVTLTHLELHGAPLGPADPRLRLSAAPAAAWSPGDPVVLSRTEDGATTSGEPVSASVVEVAGDVLLLDRPVQAPFPRAGTVVYTRSAFFSQRQLRRSDDLMNQLYRMTAEYRVSTFLDEGDATVSAPLVETTDVQVRDFSRLAAELADPVDPLYPARPATGTPGTRPVIVSRSPSSRVVSEATHG